MAAKKKEAKKEEKAEKQEKVAEREDGEAFDYRLHGVAEGATFESLAGPDDPRRRVRVVEVSGGSCVVEDLSTGEWSTMDAGELVEPHWKFVA